METTLHRRALLQTGALAAGALLLSGWRPAPASAAPLQRLPLAGGLLAWITMGPDGSAQIRHLHLDPPNQPNLQSPATLWQAASVSAWTGARLAGDHARSRAHTLLAQSWQVPEPELVNTPAAITHAPTGRTIAYRTWIDFA